MRKFLSAFILIFFGTTTAKNISVHNADGVTHSKDVTTFYGSAKIRTSDLTLSADTIDINKKSNLISAKGNVLVEHNGEIYTADEVVIYPKSNGAHAKNVQALINENYRIASKEVNIGQSGLNEATYCTFSTCKNRHGKAKKLLWDIKAEQVTYDKKAEEVKYTNAYLEIHGVPILFLPFFSHPSPKVKRKSGFLYPKITVSKNLGVMLIPKYYVSLSDNAEAILKPVLYGRHSILWSEYKHLFKNADLYLDASYQAKISSNHCKTIDLLDSNELDKIKHNGYRGHIKGVFNIRPSENYNVFMNISTVSDKSYLTIYSFLDHKNKHELAKSNLEESNFGAEYFGNKQYGIIKLATYQNIRLDNAYYKTPNIIPYFEHTAHGSFLEVPGAFYSDFITLNVDYKNDKKDNRVYWNGGYLYNFQTGNGQILSCNLDILANWYTLRKYKDPALKDVRPNDRMDRVYSNIGIEWSWPLLSTYSHSGLKAIVSPRIKVLLAPRFKKKYQDYIEHSDLVFNYLESDETNIFNESKTSKMNQINTGNKLTYGIDGSLYLASGDMANYYFFQSYKCNKQKYEIPFETGYSKRFSSILFGGSYQYASNDRIGLDVALARNLSTILRSKFYFDAKIPEGSVSVGIFCGKQFSANTDKSVFRNLFFKARYKLSAHVNTRLETMIGLKGKVLKTNFGIEYDDECLHANLSLERINYRKVDAKPDLRISFSVYLNGINSFKK